MARAAATRRLNYSDTSGGQMRWKTLVKDGAERLGFDVSRTSMAGIRHWRDIDRVRPLATLTTVFDVGAHHGETALFYARKAPNARIFSFEPTASNYEVLTRAVAGCPRIHCTRVALGAVGGELPIYEGQSSQEHSLVPHQNASGAAPERVTVATVDDFARERDVEHIDVLKTDTEGFDIEVLRGAAGMLERGAIDFVYSEVGFAREDRQHTHFIDLYHFLDGYGYRPLGLYELNTWPSPWRIGFANALFTRL
jgi:FkbM family methyltransferase